MVNLKIDTAKSILKYCDVKLLLTNAGKKDVQMSEKRDYIARAQDLKSHSFQDYIKLACELLPDNLKNSPWACNGLNHGTSILQTEDQLNCYLSAYANSHIHKVKHLIYNNNNYETPNIFKIIRIIFSSSSNEYNSYVSTQNYEFMRKPKEFQIVDWGCGQGLASIAFIECCLELIENKLIILDDGSNFLDHLKKITLIDPSKAALERATLHVKNFVNDRNIKVDTINEKLPLSHSSIEKLRSESDNVNVTINLYSNILDISEIDLNILSRQSVLSNNTIYLCVGPCNARENRIYSFLYNFNEDSVENIYKFRSVNFGRYENNRPYTCNAIFFSTQRCNSPIRELDFYTPAPKKAGYVLDIFDFDNLPSELYSKCEYNISSSYDITAETLNNINPIYAVLSNLITRGYPTKASPFIEKILSSFFKCTNEIEDIESIIFEQNDNCVNDEIMNILINTPIEVAQIQKTVIDALLTEHLFLKHHWNVFVYERDVPCAAIALKDLGEMFAHLTKLSLQFSDLQWPQISLTIISERYYDSSLHCNAKVYKELSEEIKNTIFDIVIDISNEDKYLSDKLSFSDIKVFEKSCYIIRGLHQKQQYKSSYKLRDYSYCVVPQHVVLTSERILYKNVTELGKDGRYLAIDDNVEHLKYFLRLIFRKKDFRVGQLPIINRALSLRNVIGLLPTGAGKSITYQLSALLQPGITVVIDPLVSLMKDQTENLTKYGIQHCVAINSKFTNEEKRRIQNEIEEASYQFVFLTPERLTIDNFRESLCAMHEAEIYFSYGVIDEVHCVSEWGHDFRTAYLHLGRNIKEFLKPKVTINALTEQNKISLLGLTATASFDVLSDIERELSSADESLENESCVIRYENTNRLEMQYLIINASPKQPDHKFRHYEHKQDVLCDLLKCKISKYLSECQSESNIKLMKKNYIERENLNHDEIQKIKNINISVDVNDNWYNEHDHAAIVFCPHSKGFLGPYTTQINSHTPLEDKSECRIGIAEKLDQTLNLNNKISTFTGLSHSSNQTYFDTEKNQDMFIKNESSIMVSTKAFGMGIDKPNVRFTINMCHSGSLEAFVQESGRAGRDRKTALSVILYDPTKIENSDKSIDYNIHEYFHQNSFKGQVFEKAVLYVFMTKFEFSNLHVNGHCRDKYADHGFLTNHGFMSLLDKLAFGDSIEFLVSYNNHNLNILNDYCMHHKISLQNLDNVKSARYVKILSDEFPNVLLKAVYRMCCVGIIDEYSQNYSKNCLCIKTTRKSDEQYYGCLNEYLGRYYATERVKQEVSLAKTYKGDTSYQKCLGYLSKFIYEKIAAKRLNAIKDIETFCQLGISSKTNWLETNEQLKDFLFYYFNSKFARHHYLTPDNKPYSILDDTDRGKIANFDIIKKYMKVTDDSYFIDGTPKENIKHLQGAVRFMRRASAEPNPAMDLLNVYCIFYILREYDETLLNEMKDSFISGYVGFYKRSNDYQIFYKEIDEFINQIYEMNPYAFHEHDYNLKKLKLESELLIHSEWLKKFTHIISN